MKRKVNSGNLKQDGFVGLTYQGLRLSFFLQAFQIYGRLPGYPEGRKGVLWHSIFSIDIKSGLHTSCQIETDNHNKWQEWEASGGYVDIQISVLRIGIYLKPFLKDVSKLKAALKNKS